MATPREITEQLKAESKRLGFDLCGIAPAARPDTLTFLHEWLDRHQHGEMGYLQRRRDAYAHPSGVLKDVRSLVLVGLNYFHSSTESGTGRIAKYAVGTVDYHDLIRSKLRCLSQVIHDIAPGVHTRIVVDTAPLLERDFARSAGLGWFGKNTMLINKQVGSFFFLGAILADCEFEYDPPHETAHCGTCTRCLEACPTDAFEAPYILDARKCISYLTIELRHRPIPMELRSGIGDWIFGCDVCQDVCPWNRKSKDTSESGFFPDHSSARTAAQLLSLTDAQFLREFGTTPLARPGREGMARNAAIALGNSRDPQWIPVIAKGLTDLSPIVRGACAWALGQIGTSESIGKLRAHSKTETEETVLNELDAALKSLETPRDDC